MQEIADILLVDHNCQLMVTQSALICLRQNDVNDLGLHLVSTQVNHSRHRLPQLVCTSCPVHTEGT